MGNDLDRFPQVIAAPLFGDNGFVDPPGSAVVLTAHPGMAETLIMAKVKVGLGAVIGDEDFAMLKWAHRSRIDIQVRVQFQKRDLKSPRLKQTPNRGGGKTLTQRTDYTAGDKDVFGAHGPP